MLENRAAQVVRDGLRLAAWPILRAAVPRGPKALSAMVRIRNEEQFLRTAILSIVDVLDEVVLIDNLSDDGTPSIIADLVRENPGKVRSVVYPYEIARVGRENMELAASDRGSPRLLANYYNWCVRQCTNEWVVKWDADMVALPEFAVAVDEFRASPRQVMHISGANVHPCLTHFIASDDFHRATEYYEPRVFCRRFARYADYGGPFEALYSPYRVGRWGFRHEPLSYLHFKFCRANRPANNSGDDVPAVRGERLSDELAAAAATVFA